MFRGHVILSAKNLCKGISNSRDSGRYTKNPDLIAQNIALC